MQKREVDGTKFRAALKLLLAASSNKNNIIETTPLVPEEDTAPECCICISETGPLQALFIGPCSHCYHYKCVQRLLFQSPMFQCPLCRQVSNLTASLSTDNLNLLDREEEPQPAIKPVETPMTAREEPETPATDRFAKRSKSVNHQTPKVKKSFSMKVSTFFQKVSAPLSAGSSRDSLDGGTQGSINRLASKYSLKKASSKESLNLPSLSSSSPNLAGSANPAGNFPLTPRKLGDLNAKRHASQEVIGSGIVREVEN